MRIPWATGRPSPTPRLRCSAWVRATRWESSRTWDDDLFARSRERLATEFDWVVTAQQVQCYKPETAHFDEMVRRSGIPRDRTLHIAQSLFHDIAPASALGYATVHVNRPSRGGPTGATPPARAQADVEVADMAAVAALLLEPQ